MNYLQHIQAAVFGTPWLITENGMQLVTSILINHLQGHKLTGQETQAAADSRSYGSDYQTPAEKRVAVINLHGTIFNRSSSMNLSSGGQADPQQFARAIRALADNPEVGRIVISVDSPGGTVAGTREAGDAVAYATKRKEVLAVADGQMCSAAYWIACQATRVIATPDSMIGSIGVIMSLKDTSAHEEQEGIRTVVLRTGEFKALGQEGEPIDQTVIDEKQALLDTYHAQFVDAVARGRGIPKEKAEKLANGKVWVGNAAVRAGLADTVGTLQDAINGKYSAAKTSRPQPKGQNMEHLLATLGLTADSTLEQAQAALDKHAQSLFASERTSLLAALGLKPEATQSDLATLAAQATDGQQYRMDLLAQVEALTISLEGNNEAGQVAAERRVRLLKAASIQDLRAEVADLQAKKDSAYPSGRQSKDAPEQPEIQPSSRKPVVYK